MGATLVNSVFLTPDAYRDGAIVRVDGNHAMVAYLADEADPRPVVALFDRAGNQIDTWFDSPTGGQTWTGGSTTGLYHLADNKILMFRSDAILGTSSYQLKAYEFTFTSAGTIPTPAIHVLTSVETYPGFNKWWTGGVGLDNGVVVLKNNAANTEYTLYWYEWGSGALSTAQHTLTLSTGWYRAGWTNLGAGKGLYLHPDLAAPSSSDWDLVTVSSSSISVGSSPSIAPLAFGPGTPKVSGLSAFTAYENRFVLVDLGSGGTLEPFAVDNDPNDFDGGVWSNIGDGYNAVVKFGTRSILMQHHAVTSSLELYFDDGTVQSVEMPSMSLYGLVGVAATNDRLFVTHRSGTVVTIGFEDPNLSGSLTSGRRFFRSGRA